MPTSSDSHQHEQPSVVHHHRLCSFMKDNAEFGNCLAGTSSFNLHVTGHGVQPTSPVKISEPVPSHNASQTSPTLRGTIHRRRRSTEGAMPAILK